MRRRSGAHGRGVHRQRAPSAAHYFHKTSYAAIYCALKTSNCGLVFHNNFRSYQKYCGKALTSSIGRRCRTPFPSPSWLLHCSPILEPGLRIRRGHFSQPGPRQRGPGRRVSPTVRFRSAGVSTSRRCRCVRAGFDAMPLTAQGARMRCEGWLAAGQQRGIPERPKPCSASARPGSAARCGLATRRCRPPRSPGRSAGGRRDPCGPRGRATPPSGPRGRPRGRAS